MFILNSICMVLGWGVLGLIALLLLVVLQSMVETKIRDIKTNKRVIKEGTIMYIDGKQVVINKDLTLRFKKKKAIVCECDEISSLGIRGHDFTLNKDFAQSEFENNLLKEYKNDPYYLRSVIREV